MSAERVTYLDSSAIVKLVVHDPESTALQKFLRSRAGFVSSALARVEVVRACLASDDVLRRAHDVIDRIELVSVSSRVLRAAALLLPPDTRSFDAIHLATAGLLGSSLGVLVTYDRRMAKAARQAGLRVTAPR